MDGGLRRSGPPSALDHLLRRFDESVATQLAESRPGQCANRPSGEIRLLGCKSTRGYGRRTGPSADALCPRRMDAVLRILSFVADANLARDSASSHVCKRKSLLCAVRREQSGWNGRPTQLGVSKASHPPIVG